MRSKLFVGNLNYETSVDSLESVFRPFQGYLHTKVRAPCLIRAISFPRTAADQLQARLERTERQESEFTASSWPYNATSFLRDIFGLMQRGSAIVCYVLQICYERHTGNPLGYAVVHFDNPAAAQYAIDMLHNVKVDGRHIVVAPYRPKVSDALASNTSPRPASRPAANEAVALVMDLGKTASWMDLKDIMSQRCKVLFVDEPRMIRTAFVHFASEEDMEQARAAFRNTQMLGSMVDVVPVRLLAFCFSQHVHGHFLCLQMLISEIHAAVNKSVEILDMDSIGANLTKMVLQIGMDSVLMGSEHARPDQVPSQGWKQGQLDVAARVQHMHPPPSPTYMTPAMPPMGPPYMGMDAQPYQMQRPPMMPGAHMQALAPHFAVPTMQMQGQGAPAQPSSSLHTMGRHSGGPPTPTGMAGVGGGGGPLPPGHVAGSHLEASGMQQYPIGLSGGYQSGQAAGMSPSGASTTGGAQQGAGPNPSGEGLTGSDGGASYSPDLQQLVRQLAMQQIGVPFNLSTPEDR